MCMDTIHITVEDTDPLGLDNPGFSLAEEGVVPASSSSSNSSSSSSVSIARSVSACQTAMKKRRLKALCSLPLLIPLVAAAAAEASGREEDRHRDEEGEEEEEEDENMWYLQGDAEVPLNAGGLLPPPIITLIPPTPSDIVDDDDDDQFFDGNSEGGSVTHISGSSDGVAVGDQESDNVGVDGTEEAGTEVETEEDEEEEEEEEKMGFPLAESQVDGDDEGEDVAGQDGVVPEETEPPRKESGELDSASTFLPSAYQVARLPEYPRKSEWNKQPTWPDQNLQAYDRSEAFPSTVE